MHCRNADGCVTTRGTAVSRLVAMHLLLVSSQEGAHVLHMFLRSNTGGSAFSVLL